MGGCNSSLAALAAQGAQVDAQSPIAASAFGIPLFVALAPAACDKSPTALISATNDIVSVAIARSISNCFSDQVAVQNVRMRCRPRLPEGVAVYEANSSCTQCINNVLADFTRQNNLERAQWANSPATVRQPINTYYQSILSSFESCGLTACKACVLLNLTQLNQVQASDECITSFMTRTNIQSNLSSIIQQQLLNNQDVLAGAASAFANNDLASLTTTITDSLMTVMTEQFVQDLRDTIENSQAVEIFSDTTVKLGNISQMSLATVAQKFVSDNNVALNAFSQEIFTNISQVAQQQQTLDTLGRAVFTAAIDFTSALNSSAGLVLIAVGVVLGITLLAVIGYMIYRAIKDRELRRALAK